MLLLGKVGGKPLPTVPGSPSYNKPLPPSPDSSSPQAPTFSIPSEASMRRQKMRRLAKKFGEGVPVHLVFPPTTESDDEDVVVDTPTSPVSHQDEKECYMHKPSPRRCHFVLPMKPSSLVAGQYLVHYESPGVHGYQSETFQGLKFRTIATIPEE
ncbi:hypothetical protein PHLCEN_2v4900 [Hermanssonia centrifuga]|uniref:Uncharacterized protein n=1 Tax=Hermanssonia centrifuga TaxID=98765 RepID=A0A2R6PFZ2_9APHY|nr:hypothetical protein PHLCEN_2v4900 [Hermanssonia centrifuga]